MKMGREIPVVPNGVVDRRGAPNYGTFRGELPSVGLKTLSGEHRPAWWKWRLRRKRWNYTLIVTDEILIGQAVVDGRYFGQGFLYAVDLFEERPVARASFVGLPDVQMNVNDHPARGHKAIFRGPGVELSTHRGPLSDPYRWKASLHPLILGQPQGMDGEALIDPRGGAPALTVIAPVGDGGVVNVTQKWAGLPMTGNVRIGSRTYRLNEGLAGLDYTQGILARRTAWRWAMGLGRLYDGRRVGINIVAGFNDDHPTANENALWLGDRLIALDRAQFEFSRDEPNRAWSVRTVDGAVDLYFEPYYVHHESRNLGVINSHFVQPAGRFEGRIKVDGEVLDVTLFGVTEDQDVRW